VKFVAENEFEIPWDVPESWSWTILAGIGDWSSGGTPSRKDTTNYGGSIPWTKIGDLNDGPLSQTEETISEQGLKSSSAKLVPPETLLVAMYGASIGKLGITKISCTTNQAIACCQTHDGIAPEIPFYYLRLQKNELVKLGQGGAQPNISQEILKGFPFPLPPFNEQTRIVSKIDELFSRIEEGEKALQRAKILVERYRKSVLKAAVTGELTKDWRENNKDKIEPANKLLERILKVRRENGIRKIESIPLLLDGKELPDLPDTWVWTSLGNVAHLKGGVTVDAKRKPVDPITVPYLRVANVQRGYLNLSEIKNITIERDKLDDLRLEDGDILFNEGGDLDKLGRGWIWRSELEDCIHQNHVFRGRLYEKASVPELVSWYSNTMGIEFFLDKGKQTTNLASISLTKLQQLPVPLAPLEEQQQVKRIVLEKLYEIDLIERFLTTSEKRNGALRQSILKMAFEGKLVPQDLDDEPASALLERIRSETAAPKPTKSRKVK
jgi:type I restriction enzyme, S subunit